MPIVDEKLGRESRFQPVVFFDGVCGLCNAAVDFILRYDRRGVLKFAPLQSDYAFEALPPQFVSDPSTIVVHDGKRLRVKSDAVLFIAWQMGGVFPLLTVFRIVPGFLRDALYDSIARNRFKLFGRRETCRLPAPSERARFV